MAKAAGTSSKSKTKTKSASGGHDHDHDHPHDHDHDHDHPHDHDHDHEHAAKPAKTGKATDAKGEAAVEEARGRLGAAGRNDPCPCGSGKKYKKCHLAADEAATIPPPRAPDAKELLTNGWRLFEQRRPGAAEKEFRAALAVDASLQDAHVGIGMSRLSAGNSDGAKEELSGVIAAGESEMAKVREQGTKNAFDQPEYQPFIRAAHAMGCLAYDEARYADAVKDLERVHAIDDGAVGIEARLIAAKALMKMEKPADAVAILEPAAKLEGGAGRANLGLALAHFVNGAQAPARKALDAALEANAHYAKTLLGRIRRRVENVAGAMPGSVEEALLYAQTYGDVWTDDAKKFLEEALADRPKAAAPAAETASDAP
jgi:tetratricopeptide (TPR) repeat protein